MAVVMVVIITYLHLDDLIKIEIIKNGLEITSFDNIVMKLSLIFCFAVTVSFASLLLLQSLDFHFSVDSKQYQENDNDNDNDIKVIVKFNTDANSQGTDPGQMSNGFSDWNAFRYIVAQKALAAQTFKVPKEQTIDNVRQSRLILLEGIDNAIQRLIKSDPQAMIHKPTGIFDTTHIAQLLKTDQLEAAIAELSKLQAKVIAVFGQEAANREVVPQIQNLISALKQQKPLSSSSLPSSTP
jgi:hypothetical protein